MRLNQFRNLRFRRVIGIDTSKIRRYINKFEIRSGHKSGHSAESKPWSLCESGENGRRTGLRIQRGNPWGFKSPLSHQERGALPGLRFSFIRKVKEEWR